MTFEELLKQLDEDEGGLLIDKDGVTYRGVRQSIYDDWTKLKGISTKDVRKLSDDERKSFLKDEFYDRKKLDSIKDEGLREAVFNLGVNIGPDISVKLLQEVVGTKADSLLGPKTNKAIESQDSKSVLKGFLDRVEKYYKDQKDHTNEKGWLNRIQRFRDRFETGMNDLIDRGEAYAAEIPDGQQILSDLINKEKSMPQTAQDPRESLTLLQRLLTSPQAEAMFSSLTGENKKKSPYEEGVNKALKQLGEQQAIEAAQSGVPIKQIEQQTQQMTGNTFTLSPEGLALLQQALPKQQQAQQQTVQQTPQGYDLLRNIIQSPEQNTNAQQPVQANDLSAALAGQPQKGESTPPIEQQAPGLLKRMLTGFAEGFQSGAAPDLYTQRLQKQELEQGGKLGEQERKMQSDFLLEDYKQNRLDQREELKSKLENGGFGSGASMLGAEISDFISAWDDVSLKGRVGGLAGAVGGFLGFQRGERAAFESFGSSLSWKFSEHILGQKGPAFTENERKDVEKRIIGASLSKSYSEMKAKMNAIIKMANARIPEGSEKIPDFDTILKGMKSQKKGGKNSSDVQSELEAINKRLQELGG